MKHTEAYILARGLMDKHGLQHWSFGFDNATRRLGATFHWKQRISMSKSFVKMNDLDKVTQVMLHEIAHALCDRHAGHGATWKRTALAIGCTEAKSTTSANMAPPRYQTVCPNGHVGYAKTRPRRVSRSCGRCSNVYDPQFKLTYTLNQEYVEAMHG